MTIETLKKLNELLSSVTNYEFSKWSTSPVPSPYWVGEYEEVGEANEDGRMETTFILTGTARTLLELEAHKENIRRTIQAHERMLLPNGYGLALFYSNAFTVPTDSDDYERMQINIQVFEWRTN